MAFQDNLRYLRRKAHLSQDQLADKLGYKSFTTIQKWEDGTAVPPYRILDQLAGLFQVSTDSLMNSDVSNGPALAPVMGIVRGGNPIYADNHVLGYEPLADAKNVQADGFYLQVVGDSMKDARILPGDLVYIKPQTYLDEGDIGVVMLEDEATIKRIHYQNDCLVLVPANDNYQPLTLSPADIEARHVRIVGKVLYDKINF